MILRSLAWLSSDFPKNRGQNDWKFVKNRRFWVKKKIWNFEIFEKIKNKCATIELKVFESVDWMNVDHHTQSQTKWADRKLLIRKTETLPKYYVRALDLWGKWGKIVFCDFFKMSQSFPKTCHMKKYRNWIVFKSEKQSYRYLPSKMKYRELWPKNVEFSVHFGWEVTFVASCAEFFAQKKRDFFHRIFICR